MLQYPEMAAESATASSPALPKTSPSFYPDAPKTVGQTGLNGVILEEMLLKQLLAKGQLTGRDMAEDLCLPFKLIQPLLADLKNRMIVVHRNTAALGDFFYALSEQGKELASQARQQCAYLGPAPVTLEDYLAAMAAQSIRREQPTLERLKAAYHDIVIPDEVLNTIGPAINSGRGIFLFGEPGNGKTSIAERVCRCFDQHIYIPKTLWVDGEMIHLYDPKNHVAVEASEDADLSTLDKRWICIERPTVIVGGELTLDALDVKYNPQQNISEAPLQLKANGGVFLIDDFGRQRVNHKDLLNRWIIPLEKRYDFLILSNGKKIQVPFDQLIIFSTNLNPADLVDEAFLRRIPYKIDIHSPDFAQFQAIFERQCETAGITFDPDCFAYLVQRFEQDKRAFRACHPRDLLDQVRNACHFREWPLKLTHDLIDEAYRNYFAAMSLVK